MTKRFDFGEVILTSGDRGPTSAPRPDMPFRVAMLGDWTGRSERNPVPIADRRPILVDRDNFEEGLGKLGPKLTIPLGDSSHALRFSSLDDFHPDRLFERAGIFAKLRQLRARIADPDTFPAVAKELGLEVTTRSTATPEPRRSSTQVETTASQLASGSLLDSMVEETSAQHDQGERRPRSADVFDTFVRRVTEPHLVAAANPRQAEALAMIDRILTEQLRALLHVPAFQLLEAAWRAAWFLVRRVETSAQLKLYLLDISRDELEGDLRSSQDLSHTGLYRLLVEKSVGTPGAEPWAVMVGNYEFGPTQDDAELLGRLARVAKSAGAPFLAAASPRLLGCASLAETPHPREWTLQRDPEAEAAWSELLTLSDAAWVGLALPRFLLRLPYGKETDPIEAFDFEEMAQPPVHEDYLWGNPAFACTLLLAQSFSEDGWDMRPGTHNEFDGLPLHVYDHDGESEVKPCAETLLTEEAVEGILKRGLMPLVAFREREKAVVARFQSIANREIRLQQ